MTPPLVIPPDRFAEAKAELEIVQARSGEARHLLEEEIVDAEPEWLAGKIRDLGERMPSALVPGSSTSESAWDDWMAQLDRYAGRLTRFSRLRPGERAGPDAEGTLHLGDVSLTLAAHVAGLYDVIALRAITEDQLWHLLDDSGLDRVICELIASIGALAAEHGPERVDGVASVPLKQPAVTKLLTVAAHAFSAQANLSATRTLSGPQIQRLTTLVEAALNELGDQLRDFVEVTPSQTTAELQTGGDDPPAWMPQASPRETL